MQKIMNKVTSHTNIYKKIYEQRKELKILRKDGIGN